jgi:thymidine kinase
MYFRYGTVNSAKTMNLLAVAHNYRAQNKKVLLIKPRLDDRFGATVIRSRSGLSIEADVLIDESSHLDEEMLVGCQCLLVDEAQFLTADFIDELRMIATLNNIPIICYGLRSDFRTHLFPGAKRLMEVADSIEEIKTICYYCNRKAIFNLKLVGGVVVTSGPVVDLGGEEKYVPVCSSCYYLKIGTSARI